MIKRGSLVTVKKISYDKEPELYGPVSQGYLDDYIGKEVIVTNRKSSSGNVEVLTNIENMCDTKYFLKEDLSDCGITSLKQHLKEYPHLGPDRYRIKNIIHPFKIGEWAVCKGEPNRNRDEIFQIQISSDIELIKSQLNSQYWTSVELWAPTDYEFCWFWNRDKKDMSFGRYKSTLHAHQSWDLGYQYDYCEPFINKIPSTLKGK